MWAIKIVKGPQTGQIINLQQGDWIIGRAPNVQIRLQSQGISKEHAKISVNGGVVTILDLNSRNGVFVNGTKIKSKILERNDKVGIHDIIFQLVEDRSSNANLPAAFNGNAALANMAHPSEFHAPAAPTLQSVGSPAPMAAAPPKNFAESAQQYFDTVAMPGLYRLAENFEYKWVLGGIVLVYALVVTVLAVIPMVQISRSSIEKESQRRAMTIAQSLHDRYQIALANGNTGGFETRFAEREDGVRAAIIVQASDGSILAPASRSGSYAQEPFVHRARKADDKSIEQIDSDTIGVSIPIKVYDPETGLQTPKAFAMVVYDMGALTIDDGRMISLFTQVLFIALIVGFLVFLFLYKLVEEPIRRIIAGTDNAIRKGADRVETGFQFPLVQQLSLTINSILARGASEANVPTGPVKDHYSEATQLVRIIGNPAMAVDTSSRVIAINSSLADALKTGLKNLDSSEVSRLPDDALAEIIPTLIQRVQIESGFISSPIYFRDQELEINIQAVKGGKGSDYYVVTITKPSSGGVNE